MTGGLRLFGLVGIVAGPLVVAVAVTLLEAYRSEQVAPVEIAMDRREEKADA